MKSDLELEFSVTISASSHSLYPSEINDPILGVEAKYEGYHTISNV